MIGLQRADYSSGVLLRKETLGDEDIQFNVQADHADENQHHQTAVTKRPGEGPTVEIADVREKAGAAFIVNDRVDVAIASRADGAHLGQDDFPIPLARKLLGEEAIIGGSAGNLEEARKCFLEGADYIGFGPVYFTTSKEDAGPVSGRDLLKQVVKEIPLPIIAIGGLTKDNTLPVLQTGVHGIAVISAVCCQDDPSEAAKCLRHLLEVERHA